MRLLFATALVLILPRGAGAGPLAEAAETPAPVPPYVGLARTLDPAVLDALDDEQFKARLYVALTWLDAARRGGVAPEATIKRAFDALGYSDAAAQLGRDALMRALARIDACAVLKDPANWTALSKGEPPTIREGISAGQKLISCFVVPPVRAPRFARVIANLELLPENDAAKLTPDLLDVRRKQYLAKLSVLDAQTESPGPVAPGDIPVAGSVSGAGQEPATPAPESVTGGQSTAPVVARLLKIDIPVGQVLDLTPFAGEHYGIVVNADTTSEVSYGVTDYSSYVLVTRIDAFGYPYSARVPRSNSYTREKRDGFEVPGYSGKAYPLFEMAGVVRVFYLDTLARSDNERVLLIETTQSEGR
jgi:hypothetical protein